MHLGSSFIYLKSGVVGFISRNELSLSVTKPFWKQTLWQGYWKQTLWQG